jgi:hypothetical protein
MQRNILPQHVASPTMRTFGYSDDLLGEIQTALAALADLECRYEMEREQLKLGSGSASARERLYAERESRHHRERQPYVHRLSELEGRMRARSPCR